MKKLAFSVAVALSIAVIAGCSNKQQAKPGGYTSYYQSGQSSKLGKLGQ